MSQAGIALGKGQVERAHIWGLGRHGFDFSCMALGKPSSLLGLNFPFCETGRLALTW